MTRENENDIGIIDLLEVLAIYFFASAFTSLLTLGFVGMMLTIPYVGLYYVIFEALNFKELSEICCSYFTMDNADEKMLAIDTIRCTTATIIAILAICVISIIVKLIHDKIIAKKVS